jgi:hypothetical protein
MLILLAAVLLIPMSSFGSSVIFEVRPGFGVQSFAVGIEKTKLRPYIGMDLLGISADGSYSNINYEQDMSGQLYLSHKQITEVSGSALLCIPHIGTKYHFADKGAALRPYVNGGVFMAFPFVSADASETNTYYNEDGSVRSASSDNTDLSGDEEDAIKDLLGIWGFTLGFGAEYLFSEHFGLAGEGGFRFIFLGGDYDKVDSSDWNNDGQEDSREEWEQELSATFKMTYAAVVLVFHF